MDLKHSIIKLDQHAELLWVLRLACLLNFSSGMTFSLYAPSLPAIATDFNTLIPLVKNTVTYTMFGFALGSFMGGILLDKIGRRPILAISLIGFIGASLLALLCHTIFFLSIVRFLQGVFTSVMVICGRAMVVDRFIGKPFVIAILYTSIAYGLGLVVGPFVGGLLQSHFGWHANFLFYALTALISFVLLMVFVNESLEKKSEERLSQQIKKYYSILTHRGFFAGIIMLAVVQIQQVVYPTLAVFVIVDKLNYSPSAYGYSALFVGLSYLIGSLVNRYALNYYTSEKLVKLGVALLLLGAFIQFAFAFTTSLGLAPLLIPAMIVQFSLGFIFGNVLAPSLKFFPQNAAMSVAIQTGSLMLISASGLYVLSQIKIAYLSQFGMLYLILAVILSIVMYFSSRYIFPHSS